MSLAVVTLTVVTTLLAALTILPLSSSPKWWVRAAEFPRIQISILLVAAVVATLVLAPFTALGWVVLGAQLGSLAYQAWWVIPYTKVFPVEVKRSRNAAIERRLRLMTANVLTPNRNAGGLLAIIAAADPDIVVTLETDTWWQEQLAPLERDYPHVMRCPLDNLYGMHVYSRLPLSDCATEFLVEPGVPSMHAAVTLPSGAAVRVHFLHPAPPSPTENPESSQRDAELIIVARSVAQESGPVVVTGDLNDVAWSATTRLFRKISGLLDPRVGRGMFNTYHAGHWYMRWPLDHIFHSRHFTLSQVKRLAAFGSDHFPLLTELVLDPEGGASQTGLDATTEDQTRAGEIAGGESVTPDAVPPPKDA